MQIYFPFPWSKPNSPITLISIEIFTNSNHQPIFLSSRLLILDVNAPRNEIEDAEEENDYEDEEELNDEQKIKKEDNEHPIAQSLDICMDKIFNFIKNCECSDENQRNEEKIFKILMSVFENSILPSHNTHHIQFVIFYFCSFKVSFSSTIKKKKI